MEYTVNFGFTEDDVGFVGVGNWGQILDHPRVNYVLVWAQRTDWTVITVCRTVGAEYAEEVASALGLRSRRRSQSDILRLSFVRVLP
jgi:hypothetical protein